MLLPCGLNLFCECSTATPRGVPAAKAVVATVEPRAKLAEAAKVEAEQAGLKGAAEWEHEYA